MAARLPSFTRRDYHARLQRCPPAKQTIMHACLSAMAVLGVMSVAGAARAEIVSAGPNGFNLRHIAETPNVAPPVIWAALADISKWWDPEHTYSGDARNLSLEPYVRG